MRVLPWWLHKNWLSTGWELLLKGAPHERDYLLPAPSNNYRGFKTKELRYATAFAVQTQIISLASYRGLKIFQGSTGQYYTHHSGRNFMPSGTAVLGFSKADRDILGGWSAEGSERYRRTANTKSHRCNRLLRRLSEIPTLIHSVKLMTSTPWVIS